MEAAGAWVKNKWEKMKLSMTEFIFVEIFPERGEVILFMRCLYYFNIYFLHAKLKQMYWNNYFGTFKLIPVGRHKESLSESRKCRGTCWL